MVHKIDYPKNIKNWEKIRCSKTSSHNYSFSNSTHIKEGSCCSRKALYSVDGINLCKQHAGEVLLLRELSTNK